MHYNDEAFVFDVTICTRTTDDRDSGALTWLRQVLVLVGGRTRAKGPRDGAPSYKIHQLESHMSIINLSVHYSLRP